MLAESLPPAPPALVAPPPLSHMHLVSGLANPEWLHVGIDSQDGHWGYALTIGTLAIASDVSGSLRYFWNAAGEGPYVSADAHLIQLARMSDQTPQDWTPMASIGIGYRIYFGRMMVNIGLGLSPMPVPASSQPLVVSNAQALPHVLLQLGYSL